MLLKLFLKESNQFISKFSIYATDKLSTPYEFCYKKRGGTLVSQNSFSDFVFATKSRNFAIKYTFGPTHFQIKKELKSLEIDRLL